ncbi:MAG: hypothetical protein WC956_10320 [bacterium]
MESDQYEGQAQIQSHSVMDFTYGADNRLSQIKNTMTTKPNDPNPTTDVRTTDYDYYNEGRVKSITITSVQPPITTKYEFGYDASGRMSSRKDPLSADFVEWSYLFDNAQPLKRSGTAKHANIPIGSDETVFNDKSLPTSHTEEMTLPTITYKNEVGYTYNADGMLSGITVKRSDFNMCKTISSEKISYNTGKPDKAEMTVTDCANPPAELKRLRLATTWDGTLLKTETTESSTDQGTTWKPADSRTFTYDTTDTQALTPPLELILIDKMPAFMVFLADKPELFFDRP